MTCILFETLRRTAEEHESYWLDSPEFILETNKIDEVSAVLERVETMVSNGYFAAGFLAYEAGFTFLPKLSSPPRTDLPLVWFALSRDVKKPDRFPLNVRSNSQIRNLSLNLKEEFYSKSIERIRDYIAKGDTYQVNFTMRYRGDFEGSPAALYSQLRKKQKVSYAAFIESDDWSIVSLSPELFFRKSKENIIVRPMKGTAPRGRTLEEDELNADLLITSPKETSENLMIVDLLRNDLGKICKAGSIQVTRSMEIERYETLLQMTSTIRGILNPGIRVSDILRAAFPSGSVTGAPKLRTMQIIQKLEPDPRGVYTGAIGFLSQEDACFSVAIRTAIVDKRKGTIEMGVGSGILYEADPKFEFSESKLKGNFLTQEVPDFQLLETLLWEPQTGFRYLEQHSGRVISSAVYFLFPLNQNALLRVLQEKDTELRRTFTESQRVRLLVDQNGKIELQTSRLEPLHPNPAVCISSKRTNSSDRFLFHKTTNRKFYDHELADARERGYFDVLFKNERGELTEGAITNVVIQKGNNFYTPPVECGLLPGIFRQSLFKEISISERVLHEEDLFDADAVYVCNSVQGLLKVKLN